MVIQLKVPGIRREAGAFRQEPMGQPICVSGGSPVKSQITVLEPKEAVPISVSTKSDVGAPRVSERQRSRHQPCLDWSHWPLASLQWVDTWGHCNTPRRCANKDHLHLARTDSGPCWLLPFPESVVSKVRLGPWIKLRSNLIRRGDKVDGTYQSHCILCPIHSLGWPDRQGHLSWQTFKYCAYLFPKDSDKSN